jgi:hypothetical protein
MTATTRITATMPALPASYILPPAVVATPLSALWVCDATALAAG